MVGPYRDCEGHLDLTTAVIVTSNRIKVILSWKRGKVGRGGRVAVAAVQHLARWSRSWPLGTACRRRTVGVSGLLGRPSGRPRGDGGTGGRAPGAN